MSTRRARRAGTRFTTTHSEPDHARSKAGQKVLDWGSGSAERVRVWETGGVAQARQPKRSAPCGLRQRLGGRAVPSWFARPCYLVSPARRPIGKVRLGYFDADGHRDSSLCPSSAGHRGGRLRPRAGSSNSHDAACPCRPASRPLGHGWLHRGLREGLSPERISDRICGAGAAAVDGRHVAVYDTIIVPLNPSQAARVTRLRCAR